MIYCVLFIFILASLSLCISLYMFMYTFSDLLEKFTLTSIKLKGTAVCVHCIDAVGSNCITDGYRLQCSNILSSSTSTGSKACT